MADGPVWTFEQLGGLRKKLELSGYSAPFGRPRVGAVVRTPIKLREERVRYPGGSSTTHHLFGHQYEDWELKGRFRDRALGGPGKARIKTEEVKAFVQDGQLVRIFWGEIFAFRGLLTEFDPGYESPAEVEWILRIQIDADDNAARPPTFTQPPDPPVTAADLVYALGGVEAAWASVDLPGDLLLPLDALIVTLSNAVNTAAQAARLLASWRDGSVLELGTIVVAMARAELAAVAFRETFAAVPPEVVLSGRAADVIALQSAQVTVEELVRALLATGQTMEGAAAKAQAARIKGTLLAATGDTWDAVSTKIYGSPDRADELRQVNSGAPGSEPTPGVEYLLPK